VLVDSFKFLPRSFIAMYEHVQPEEGDSEAVWAPFVPRLADASIALVTSAGLSLAGEQVPFDLDRERREPTWGDPTYRVLAHGIRNRELVMSHLHVNDADVLADRNVALPIDRLDDLVVDGRVGSAAPSHVSVMGYQEHGLAVWREATAPAMVELFKNEGTDGVVFAPV
jgi:D-proline reductase (dithiol) PrdB